MKDSNGTCEFIIVLLKIKNRCILLVNIYRPPNCPQDEFSSTLTKIMNCPELKNGSTEIVITGDFNIPECTWNIYGNINYHSLKTNVKSLNNFMEELLLTQCVTKPTRGKNILDLVLTNNKTIIENIVTTPTIHSDHFILDIETDLNPPDYIHHNKPDLLPLSDLNLYKSDWKTVNSSLLDTNWEEILADLDPENCWKKIEHILTTILHKNAPKSHILIKNV